jgi:hypothetical protein
MKRNSYLILVSGIAFLCSCSVIEKSSRHGFESGYYYFKSDSNKVDTVYLDITGDKIAAFSKRQDYLNNKEIFDISLLPCDTPCPYPVKFSKQSLDIDLTTILFKFRPGVNKLPAQLNTDFNIALYAGWRHDKYIIRSKKNPLNKCNKDVINRGFDFGFFAGPGTTLIGPFTTNNAYTNEYYGTIIQYGIAGFIESNVASFGISTGFDYLVSHDRNIWIYNKKPWIGFIIGIAMN